MKVIAFERQYAAEVAQLYHTAVQAIDRRHYSDAQLAAWSNAPRSARHWQNRLTATQAWLMIDESRNQCAGFINVDTQFYSRGYIDSLYVLPDYQQQGLARQLYVTLEAWAKTQHYRQLSTDASLLSKSLFLNHGFDLRYKTYQQKRGQIIKGFYLEKPLMS